MSGNPGNWRPVGTNGSRLHHPLLSGGRGRKPGIAIMYKNHLDVLSRAEVVRRRLQFVDFGPLKVLNLYAHSGHNKMAERVEFFNTKLFKNT